MNERQKRLKEAYEHVRKFFGIHTQEDFAKSLHKSRNAITLALNGNEKYLTDNLFSNICEAFPGVFNLNYLLTGEGELLSVEEEAERHESIYNPAPSYQHIDPSSLINALLAKTDETISALKRELAAKDEIIQAKDERIADLTKLAEERLHRIAELRRAIDSGSVGINSYPFPIGAAEERKYTKK